MGYNSMFSRRVIVDLETVPMEGAAEYVPPPNLDDCHAPSNWKDEAKIKTEIARKQAEAQAAYESSLGLCALDWNLNRIVAIGIWDEAEADPLPVVCLNTAQERQALATLWMRLRGAQIVGFCTRSFDVPTLIQRSRYLDLKHPYISLARYGKGDVIDLRDVLTFDDARYEAVMPRSLTAFCRRFGIDVPDSFTGADMAAAVAEGRWDDVKAHVLADVQKTARLAARLGYFQLPAEKVA